MDKKNARLCSYKAVEPVYEDAEKKYFLENREVACRLITDLGKMLCPRHELMTMQGIKQPDRWQCWDCDEKFAEPHQNCPSCGGDHMEEIPCEIPL